MRRGVSTLPPDFAGALSLFLKKGTKNYYDNYNKSNVQISNINVYRGILPVRTHIAAEIKVSG